MLKVFVFEITAVVPHVNTVKSAPVSDGAVTMETLMGDVFDRSLSFANSEKWIQQKESGSEKCDHCKV